MESPVLFRQEMFYPQEDKDIHKINIDNMTKIHSKIYIYNEKIDILSEQINNLTVISSTDNK